MLGEKDTNDNDNGIKNVKDNDISNELNELVKPEVELKKSYRNIDEEELMRGVVSLLNFY